jgi:membrane fusion protein, multidrug efflux system
VTALAAEGQRVEPGDVLFSIDGRPSVLLTGTQPAFRELGEGVDDGADVAQLEENLVALGFADDDLAVDEHFDAETAAAVQAWQEALGVDPTGRTELGDIVFASAPATVAASHAAVGDPVSPGAHVLDVTGDTVLAVGHLPARLRDEVEEGSPTEITLADGSAVSGTVRSIASETTRPEDADVTDSTVELTVQLDATDSTAARAGADAALAVTTATRSDVLAVPVAAIVDGGDGRAAVRIPGGDGRTGAPVAIEAGLSANGYVEVVDGALEEGDTVLLPGPEPEG